MSAIAGRHRRRSIPTIKKGWGATVDRYIDRVVGAADAAVAAGADGGGRRRAADRLRQPGEPADGARDAALARDRAAPRARRRAAARVVRMLLTESLLLSALGAIARRRASATGCCAGFRACCRRSTSPPKRTSAWTAGCCCSSPRVTILTSVAFGLTPALQRVAARRRRSAEGRRTRELRRTPRRPRAPRVRRRAGGRGVHPAGWRRPADSQLPARDGRRHRLRHRRASSPRICRCRWSASPSPLALTQYIQQLLDEVRAVPGVQRRGGRHRPSRCAAGAMACRSACRRSRTRSSAPASRSSRPATSRRSACGWSPAACSTSRDTAGSVPVVVVNESFVRRYFAEQEPDRRAGSWSSGSSRRGAGSVRRPPGRSSAWWRTRKASGLENADRRRRLRQLRAESRRRPRPGRARQRRSGDADQVDPARGVAGEQVSGARSADDRRAAQGAIR